MYLPPIHVMARLATRDTSMTLAEVQSVPLWLCYTVFYDKGVRFNCLAVKDLLRRSLVIGKNPHLKCPSLRP